MIEMNLAIAEQAARAAQTKARELGTPMTVSVVDEAGRLVYPARGDGAGFFRVNTSRANVAAANFKRSTKELGELMAKGQSFWTAVGAAVPGELLPRSGPSPSWPTAAPSALSGAAVAPASRTTSAPWPAPRR